MSLLDKKTTGDAVRLVIFILVTTIATSFLVVTIGNISFAASKQYKAVFSDATGVVEGRRRPGRRRQGRQRPGRRDRRPDQGAGHLQGRRGPGADRQHQGDHPLPQPGRPALHLPERRASAVPTTLPDGATIPLDRTAPALDLTVLFNGFKPLFAALSPEDINKLSYEIVTVFQGEGGTLESLLSHTASVTSTLASRDQVIGSLITNLNEVMVTIGNRDDQLSDLLIKLRQFVSGLSDDRQAILGSLDSISGLAVADLRPGHGHPAEPHHGRQAAAQGRREPRPQQGRDRPGAPGAADQAEQGRADRDLRLVLQLLPVQLQGRREVPGRLAHQGSPAWTTTPTRRGVTSDEHSLP